MTNELLLDKPPEPNITLEEAWTRFGKYDLNAIKARKRFIRQRKLILILTVAATTLAVFYSVMERQIKPDGFLLVPWFSQKEALDLFHGLVIITPILLSIMTAGAIRFNQGLSWIMLRTSAEAIKKEILCYRMRVAEYSAEKTKIESRDMRLARKIKMISKRLMETQVNQTGLEPYKGPIPPVYGPAKGDDGFSDLDAEQYIQWRVEDQFNYYQKKAFLLSKELQQFQWLVFILGGLGTLLAAFGFDVWIAVSSALGAAFTGFLEFKRVETNVIACNLSAADLYDIRIWWHALSPSARAERTNIEILVASTERVLQTENAGWLQEMREALAEIYREKKDAGLEPGHEPLEHPSKEKRTEEEQAEEQPSLDFDPFLAALSQDPIEIDAESKRQPEASQDATASPAASAGNPPQQPGPEIPTSEDQPESEISALDPAAATDVEPEPAHSSHLYL